jgi:hypothetical protein
MNGPIPVLYCHFSFLRSKKHPKVVRHYIRMHPAHTWLKLRDEIVPG